MTSQTPMQNRTVALAPDGSFTISDDPDHVLANFVGMITRGQWVSEIDQLFAPEGDGVWVDTLGGAIRVTERESLPSPWDEDPGIDPEHDEWWVVQRERRSGPDQQVMLAGEELRALLTQGRALVSEPPGAG